MRNYLPTANPFNLATPPAWFLKALHAYDPLLVIFPSTHEPQYRVGRRGRYGHGMLRALTNKPDSVIYVQHKLWPWKSLNPQHPSLLGGGWQRVLFDLTQFDTQRFGTSEDAADALDNLELAQEQALDRQIASDLDALGHESYNLYKLLEGSRVGAGARPEGAGFKKFPGKAPKRARQRDGYRPLGAGAGGIFVGR